MSKGFNTTLDRGGNGGGGEAAKLAVSITYAALKALRDGGNLVPGTWYRITDYVCTTTQANTQSAEHQFDIIVRADDDSHLNENGYAAHHEGDNYFANCKLEAWELKYSLDNDTNRFAWADDENGTGVVYWMKDEWNNECPYDFKNIMFKRFKAEDVTSDGHLSSLDGKYVGFDGDESPRGMEVDNTDSIWCYTFSALDLVEEVLDASLNTLDFNADEYAPNYCYSNVIKECQIAQLIDDNQNVANKLNNIVFINDGVEEGIYYAMSQPLGNEIDVDNTDITFLNNALYNKIGKNCTKLTFGNDCWNNSFGNNCWYNSFGNYCQTITVFDGVQYCSVTGGTQQAPVKNAQILNGTAGASAQNKLTITFAANKNYTQVAAKTTAGSLKIFNPADLVE